MIKRAHCQARCRMTGCDSFWVMLDFKLNLTGTGCAWRILRRMCFIFADLSLALMDWDVTLLGLKKTRVPVLST